MINDHLLYREIVIRTFIEILYLLLIEDQATTVIIQEVIVQEMLMPTTPSILVLLPIVTLITMWIRMPLLAHQRHPP